MRYHRTKGTWQRQNRHGYTDGASARREPCRCQPAGALRRTGVEPQETQVFGPAKGEKRPPPDGDPGCLTGEEDNG